MWSHLEQFVTLRNFLINFVNDVDNTVEKEHNNIYIYEYT